jgi:hypothetical protein
MRRRDFIGVALGALAAGRALAQQAPDIVVPFVPTPQVTVDEMLRIAGVGPKDFVLDLGSGDGRIVITAAKKFGARGLGVDLDHHLVIQSEEGAKQAGVEERAKFIQQDIFKTDLHQATVITMYLLPFIVRRLKPSLLALKPGTRIVSHDFDMEDWKPDQKTYIRKNVFLWIVPAPVAGRWQARIALPPIERQLDIEIKQRFQEVDAHARLNGVPTQVWETKIEGDRLSFTIVDTTDRENEAMLYFDGRVAGEVIDGALTRGVGTERAAVKWRAVRVAK